MCKSTFNFRWEWAGCLRIAHGSIFTFGMWLIRTQIVCRFSLSSFSLLSLSLVFFPPPQPSHMKTCFLLSLTHTHAHTHTKDSFSATRAGRNDRKTTFTICDVHESVYDSRPDLKWLLSTHPNIIMLFVNTHFCRFVCSAVVHIEHEQAETFAVQVEFGLKLRWFLFKMGDSC